MTDVVDHPPHYTAHPSNVEAIELCEWLSFNTGNALKYVWRAGQKGSRREDLSKALWYIEREISRKVHGMPTEGLPNEFLAARARLVVQQERPVSLLAVMIMSLAMPPVVARTHLDNARYHLEQAIGEIKVHRLVIQTGRLDGKHWQSKCGLQEKNQEHTSDDALVTCEECRKREGL